MYSIEFSVVQIHKMKIHVFSRRLTEEVIITWFVILPDVGIYKFKQNVLIAVTVVAIYRHCLK